MNSQDFFYFQSQDEGTSSSENLVFKSYIQEFYQKIAYISNLEAKGYITSQEAYQQIKFFWKQLKTLNKLSKISLNNFNKINHKIDL